MHNVASPTSAERTVFLDMSDPRKLRGGCVGRLEERDVRDREKSARAFDFERGAKAGQRFVGDCSEKERDGTHPVRGDALRDGRGQSFGRKGEKGAPPAKRCPNPTPGSPDGRAPGGLGQRRDT